MSENGGSLWGGGSPWNGAYRDLNQKIDNVAENFRLEINTIRSEMQAGNAQILDKIDRVASAATARPTNPFQLIGTAVGIIALLGTWFGYVSNNLGGDISSNKAAIEEEAKGRLRSEERMYDLIGKNAEKAWSKDAHAEFERRIDDRNQMEQEYAKEHFAKLDRDLVPREENDQRWRDQTEDVARLERQLTASLDRLAEHVNKSDDGVTQKFSDIEKTIHGYGIADEVKDLQSQVRDVADKIFRLIAPNDGPPAKKPAGN